MFKIITDSAADITLNEAQKMGIEVVPLFIEFADETLTQNTREDFDLFFQKLAVAQTLPKTSRPSPEMYLHHIEEAKKRQEEVLIITLSSGLSGTIESARLAAKISGCENVFVVDSEQAILTQRMLVEYAVKRRAEGAAIRALVTELNDLKKRMVVCGVVHTLKYLRMGGRIPRSLEITGELLRVKPVILLKDRILQDVAKVRGMKAGKHYLHQLFESYEVDEDFPVYFGYTANESLGSQWRAETQNRYRLNTTGLFPIGGVIGTHVGPNCIALAFVTK